MLENFGRDIPRGTLRALLKAVEVSETLVFFFSHWVWNSTLKCTAFSSSDVSLAPLWVLITHNLSHCCYPKCAGGWNAWCSGRHSKKGRASRGCAIWKTHVLRTVSERKGAGDGKSLSCLRFQHNLVPVRASSGWMEEEPVCKQYWKLGGIIYFYFEVFAPNFTWHELLWLIYQ